ncbi:THO complex subunit 2 [Smittium mucronatum]|uniref:THO complex subunit 2 n=1 Tax=Smittium mucronatum TaxID=133383 RepID=A0A1R0GVH7_9FUNG|nr:THO complex subunit 2 [Smittium mucronatum]
MRNNSSANTTNLVSFILECSELSEVSDFLVGEIQKAIGIYSIDPNRVADIILDLFIANLKYYWPFFIAIFSKSELWNLKNPSNTLSQLLGHKLQFFQKNLAIKENYIPEEIIGVASLLISNNIIDISILYNFLSPTDEEFISEIKKINKELLELAGSSTYSLANMLSLDDLASGDDDDGDILDEGSVGEEKENTTKDTVINQKILLIYSLLGNGDLSSSLMLLNKFPGITTAFPEVSDYICRILERLIVPISENLNKNFFVRQSDYELVRRGQLKNINPEYILWINPFPPNGLSYRKRISYFFETFWTINKFPIINDINDLPDTMYPWLSLIGPQLSRNIVLLTDIIRICKVELSNLDLPTELKLNSKWTGIFRLFVIPAISKAKCNPALINEAWGVLNKFDIRTRFSIYHEWKDLRYSENVEMEAVKKSSLSEIRSVLRRLSKETVKTMGRKLCKVCHMNPLVALPLIVDRISYDDNLIGPIVEALRFLTPLGIDILMFVAIEVMFDNNRPRVKKNGVDLSNWLSSLCNFTSTLVRRFSTSNPDLLLTCLVQKLVLVLNGAEKNQDVLFELEILNEFLIKLAAIEPLSNPSLQQIQALQGGPLLIREAYQMAGSTNTQLQESMRIYMTSQLNLKPLNSFNGKASENPPPQSLPSPSQFNRGNSRARLRLVKSLVENNLVPALMIGLSKQTQKILFGLKNNARSLKATMTLYDIFHVRQLQFLHFCQSYAFPYIMESEGSTNLHTPNIKIPDLPCLHGKNGLTWSHSWMWTRAQLKTKFVKIISDWERSGQAYEIESKPKVNNLKALLMMKFGVVDQNKGNENLKVDSTLIKTETVSDKTENSQSTEVKSLDEPEAIVNNPERIEPEINKSITDSNSCTNSLEISSNENSSSNDKSESSILKSHRSSVPDNNIVLKSFSSDLTSDKTNRVHDLSSKDSPSVETSPSSKTENTTSLGESSLEPRSGNQDISISETDKKSATSGSPKVSVKSEKHLLAQEVTEDINHSSNLSPECSNYLPSKDADASTSSSANELKIIVSDEKGLNSTMVVETSLEDQLSSLEVIKNLSLKISGIPEDLVQYCTENLPESATRDGFLPEFYVVFWILSLYDIEVPTTRYQSEISRLNSFVKSVSAFPDLANFHNSDSSSSHGKLNRLALNKEKDRAQLAIKSLEKELVEQSEHVKRVNLWLMKQKNYWFSLSCNERIKVTENLFQYCIFPRAINSSSDAIFSAKFIILNQYPLETVYFPTLILIDRVFSPSLSSMLESLTEDESINYSLFLNTLLAHLQVWHIDCETYMTECIGSGRGHGFVHIWSTVKGSNAFNSNMRFNASHMLSHNNFIKLNSKWHTILHSVFTSAIKSDDLDLVRKALLGLRTLSEFFPTTLEMGTSLLNLVKALVSNADNLSKPDYNLGPAKKEGSSDYKQSKSFTHDEIEDESSNTPRQDIKVLARAYVAILESKKAKWASHEKYFGHNKTSDICTSNETSNNPGSTSSSESMKSKDVGKVKSTSNTSAELQVSTTNSRILQRDNVRQNVANSRKRSRSKSRSRSRVRDFASKDDENSIPKDTKHNKNSDYYNVNKADLSDGRSLGKSHSTNKPDQDNHGSNSKRVKSRPSSLERTKLEITRPESIHSRINSIRDDNGNPSDHTQETSIQKSNQRSAENSKGLKSEEMERIGDLVGKKLELDADRDSMKVESKSPDLRKNDVEDEKNVSSDHSNKSSFEFGASSETRLANTDLNTKDSFYDGFEVKKVKDEYSNDNETKIADSGKENISGKSTVKNNQNSDEDLTTRPESKSLENFEKEINKNDDYKIKSESKPGYRDSYKSTEVLSKFSNTKQQLTKNEVKEKEQDLRALLLSQRKMKPIAPTEEKGNSFKRTGTFGEAEKHTQTKKLKKEDDFRDDRQYSQDKKSDIDSQSVKGSNYDTKKESGNETLRNNNNSRSKSNQGNRKRGFEDGRGRTPGDSGEYSMRKSPNLSSGGWQDNDKGDRRNSSNFQNGGNMKGLNSTRGQIERRSVGGDSMDKEVKREGFNIKGTNSKDRDFRTKPGGDIQGNIGDDYRDNSTKIMGSKNETRDFISDNSGNSQDGRMGGNRNSRNPAGNRNNNNQMNNDSRGGTWDSNIRNPQGIKGAGNRNTHDNRNNNFNKSQENKNTNKSVHDEENNYRKGESKKGNGQYSDSGNTLVYNTESASRMRRNDGVTNRIGNRNRQEGQNRGNFRNNYEGGFNNNNERRKRG